jgi:LysR family transcriptional regulator, cell division regulator
MINQTDLKYFMELAQTKHVSRSAERLGVTQPTLSHCLKRLESTLGTELFIRSKKGIQLTAAGLRLQESAQELIAKWSEVFKSVSDEVDEVKGLIRIGCHSAVAQYILPGLIPDFLKKHHEIQLSLTHGLSRHMTEMVVSSQLDLAFVVNPTLHPDLVIKEIATDRVTFWKSKKCENPDVLFVEPSLLQTQDLLRKMNKKGLQFTRTIESSSLEVIAQLLNSGAGCAILPERVMKALCDNSVVQIKDAIEFHDRICLVYKHEFRKLKRGQALIEFASKNRF